VIGLLAKHRKAAAVENDVIAVGHSRPEAVHTACLKRPSDGDLVE